MKRILNVLATICLFLPIICVGNPKQGPELTEKQKKLIMGKQNKGAGAYVKAIKKAGFELIDSGMLDAKVLRHIMRRDAFGSDGVEFLGWGRSRSNNLGKQMAKRFVVCDYMNRAEMAVNGRIIYDNPLVNDSIERVLSKCLSAYERAMEPKISEFINESYSIRRPVQDGRYEILTMFLVDEKEARKARLEAMEEAIAESGVDSEFVNYLKECAGEPILNRYEDVREFITWLKK